MGNLGYDAPDNRIDQPEIIKLGNRPIYEGNYMSKTLSKRRKLELTCTIRDTKKYGLKMNLTAEGMNGLNHTRDISLFWVWKEHPCKTTNLHRKTAL